MNIGLIGLGRMGWNISLNLINKGFELVVFNRTTSKVDQLVQEGAQGAYSFKELAEMVNSPRFILLMVQAGAPVDEMIKGLLPYLKTGDTIIEGGNSFYKDSMRRAEELKDKGINFLDVGTSGGLVGARQGASLTIGGEEKTYKEAEELFKALSLPGGYCYTGPSGSGHFVKMVHNGIEYAMLQSYGEGFELLQNGPYDLELSCIAKAWNNGGVIRSWLLELAVDTFQKDPALSGITGKIGGGETGEWTIKTAIEYKTPVPLMSTALQMRYRSRQDEPFAGKVIAALRNQFGGHEITRTDDS